MGSWVMKNKYDGWWYRKPKLMLHHANTASVLVFMIFFFPLPLCVMFFVMILMSELVS